MRHRITFMLAGAAALAGCASNRPSARPAPQAQIQPVLTIPVNGWPAGLDLVLGRTAQALSALFGQPALDVREGSARKLQFLGTNCVLDVYLYPRAGGAEAVVTHVDTRLPDGRDADRAACIAALRR